MEGIEWRMRRGGDILGMDLSARTKELAPEGEGEERTYLNKAQCNHALYPHLFK